MGWLVGGGRLCIREPPRAVLRPRLVERLDEGLHRKLTLVSAPAGFGKTTLLSAWVAGCDERVAWLSLDEGDNDRTRFLNYLVAALRSIEPTVGEGAATRVVPPDTQDGPSMFVTAPAGAYDRSTPNAEIRIRRF